MPYSMGFCARFTVLPWEDEEEYSALLAALTAEHAPHGPTEDHLVEELAGVLWRKRRLRLAEASSYHRALKATTDSYSKTAQAALILAPEGSAEIDVAMAIKAHPENAQREIDDLEADRKMTLKSLEILRSGKVSVYEKALSRLHETTREAWQDQLSWEPGDYGPDDTPYAADTASLLRFLEDEILDWYDRERTAIALRPVVRAQALGEALDPDKLERLARYEVHLDRKFERTLSALLRLEELRRSRPSCTA